jgi:negative regulator of sigma E activity
MTHDELGPADIDRLADYIGGALDGPEEAEVARLVAEDPRWRETHDLLAPGMTAVAAELRTMGAATEPMPDDLAARLDEALTAEPRRHLSVVPGTGDTAATRPRRRLRWAVPAAVAAGVLAFAGFGIDYLAGQTGGSAEQASSAAGDSSAEHAAPMLGADDAGAASDVRADQIRESGTNYTVATLATVPAAFAAKASEPMAAGQESALSGGQRVSDMGAGELDRLRARAALQTCIGAISQVHGTGPVAVETVDYARYDGRPALVVRFTAASATWAYAVGPNCGTPDRGADLLQRVQVG